MSVLLDTNILTRLSGPSHPNHAVAKSAILKLQEKGEPLHLGPQNLYEFWTVATRPVEASNGLGLTVDQTKAELSHIRSLFVMLPDTPAIYAQWEHLVIAHDVRGKATHDAGPVAAMVVHGVTEILTFNGRDLLRYQMVTVLDPLTSSQPL